MPDSNACAAHSLCGIIPVRDVWKSITVTRTNCTTVQQCNLCGIPGCDAGLTCGRDVLELGENARVRIYKYVNSRFVA